MKRVVARDQQVVGTYDDAKLVALLNAGTLKLTDQHWDAATSAWRPLTDFVGHATRRRSFAAAIGRIAVLLLVAACGSAATWWVMRDLEAASAAIHATLGIVPEKMKTRIETPEESPQPQPTAAAAATTTEAGTPPVVEKSAKPEPAPGADAASSKRHPSEVLTLLNVEVFDEELAVTVENHGREPVDGFDLKLKFFDLPAGQRVFDQNAKEISEAEAGRQSLAREIEPLDKAIAALGLHLKLASSDVITWTPSHIKALPGAEQWAAFGDAALAEAGASLKDTARAFADGASSLNATVRHEALTGHLLALARKLEDIRPLIQSVIDKKQGERRRLAAEQDITGRRLAVLRRAQEELQPELAPQMEAARSKARRVEITHVDAVIEPESVRRVAISRAKSEREGVAVELARPDDKSVAIMRMPAR